MPKITHTFVSFLTERGEEGGERREEGRQKNEE
jgi:hypothetical protein